MAGVVLALANATAYATVVFDLFVAAVALLTALQGCGSLAAARRAATVLVVAAALLAAALLAGGGGYLGGFARTTLARVPGSATPQAVLASSWQWGGAAGHPGLLRDHHQRGRPAARGPDIAARGAVGPRRWPGR